MVLRVGDGTRVTVWQCIGCGKIEGPQPCVGVCQDRKVEFVPAEVHDAIAAENDALRLRTQSLEDFVRRLVRTTPRDGEWEHSYRALQEQARRALERSRDGIPP
ncbi:MAG: hypothetical protein U1F52_18840 [Burkholderiales bacterium]